MADEFPDYIEKETMRNVMDCVDPDHHEIFHLVDYPREKGLLDGTTPVFILGVPNKDDPEMIIISSSSIPNNDANKWYAKLK